MFSTPGGTTDITILLFICSVKGVQHAIVATFNHLAGINTFSFIFKAVFFFNQGKLVLEYEP